MARKISINQYEQKQDLRLSGPLSQRIQLEGARQSHNLDAVKGIGRQAGRNFGSSYQQASRIPGNVSRQSNEFSQRDNAALYGRRVESLNKVQRRQDLDYGLVAKPSGSNIRNDRSSGLMYEHQPSYDRMQSPIPKAPKTDYMGFPISKKLSSDSLKKQFNLGGY